MHVAAVAQLVREERKGLEQIHPKACCPTCLYTHIYLSFAVLYSTLFCPGNSYQPVGDTVCCLR